MKRAGTITGGHVLWGFVAFFALIVAANGVMVVLALGSWTGLETDRHYVKGLEYNRVLEAGERQALLGWKGEVAAGTGVNGGTRIDFLLFDGEGRPVDDARVVTRFIRPTHEGFDFDVSLSPAGGGRYQTEVELPLAGQWDIRVLAERGGDRFVRRSRVVLE